MHPDLASVDHLPQLAEQLLRLDDWPDPVALPNGPPGPAYCLVEGTNTTLFQADMSQPTHYRHHIAAVFGVPAQELFMHPARPRPGDVELDGHPCRTVISICPPGTFGETMKGVLIDCRPACHSWMTMWLTGDLLDVDLLQERLDAIAPVGCGIRLVDVPPGVLLFQVAQGQVLAIEVVPLDILSPDFSLTTAEAGPLGARPVDSPSALVLPDDHPSFGTSGPAGVTVAHTEPALGGPGSALVGIHPALYFAATFFVFTPAYQPERVEVRLLPGSTVPDALAIVAAARLPMPRLRFPRLLPARFQTFHGAAVAIAIPP